MATVTDPIARRSNNALELLHNPDRGYLQPGESPPVSYTHLTLPTILLV